MIVKRALKRSQTIPIGVSIVLHIDCECGVAVMVQKNAEKVFCSCGMEYDSHGWILKRPEVKS